MSLQKITPAEILEKGVVGSPDILTGSPQQNKEIFDRLVAEVVAVKYNNLVDALTSTTGATEIGATEGPNPSNVQEAIDSVQRQVADVVLGQIPDYSITPKKLAWEPELPFILWLYTLGYPMTPEQREAVENNPSLMEIFNNSKLTQATKEEAEAGESDYKYMTPKKVVDSILANGGQVKNQHGKSGTLFVKDAVPTIDWSDWISESPVDSTYAWGNCCETENYIAVISAGYLSTMPAPNINIFKFDKRTKRSRTFTLPATVQNANVAARSYQKSADIPEDVVLVRWQQPSSITCIQKVYLGSDVDTAPAWLGAKKNGEYDLGGLQTFHNGLTLISWSISGNTITLNFLDYNLDPIVKIISVAQATRIDSMDAYGNLLAIGVSANSTAIPTKVVLLDVQTMTYSEIGAFTQVGSQNYISIVVFNEDGSKLTCLSFDARSGGNALYQSFVYDIATGFWEVTTRSIVGLSIIDSRDGVGMWRDRRAGIVILPFNQSFMGTIKLDGTQGPYIPMTTARQYFGKAGAGKLLNHSNMSLIDLSTMTMSPMVIPLSNSFATDNNNQCRLFDSGWGIVTKITSTSNNNRTHLIFHLDYKWVIGFEEE